jgi:hypothetical protein
MNQTTEATAYGPYTITSNNGPLDPDARYFVLRYDADAPRGFFARQALRLYCDLIKAADPKLAELLWHDLEAESAEGEGE